MPSIHFLRQEGVVSCPHCMLFLLLMQETNSRTTLQHVTRESHTCMSRYVHTTLVCNSPVLFCSVCSEDYIEAGIARHGTALPFT